MMFDTRAMLGNKDCGNLIVLSKAQSDLLKEKLLEICKDVFSFCEEKNLCCMLGGGSALGAVRHGGFIPWDDDLDLIMPRADYDRFAREFEASMGDKYTLFVPDGNHRATNLFMKVSMNGTALEDILSAGRPVKTGITIDIFPIENVPDNGLKRKIKGIVSDAFAYAAVSAYMFQCRNPVLKSVYSASFKGKVNYAVRLLLGASMSYMNYEQWYCLFDRFSKNDNDNGLCTIPTGRKHYAGELTQKDMLYPPRAAKFESAVVKLPKDTDAYLKRLYGDYHVIPPEDKRERHYYTEIGF